MKYNERIPSKRSSLEVLKSTGVAFDCVLDVGVQTKTQELIDVFPDCLHYLFEPVAHYFALIRKNYSGIEHEIIAAAVSSRDGKGRLELKTLGATKAVTHSNVVADEVKNGNAAVQGNEVVDIELLRLSTFIQGRRLLGPILLKIDVDGHEAAILEGLKGQERRVGCVVIESPLHAFVDLADTMRSMGFVLWDIVDFCYYRSCLAQVDAIYISADLAAKPELQPLKLGGAFEFSAWQSFRGK